MTRPHDSPADGRLTPLGREEYIEQAYFFATLTERLQRGLPAQEVLQSVREEILATTKLPMAVDFLLGELRHLGVFGPGMRKLEHYFTPFQRFIIEEAENERRRFDLRIGLEILHREVEYRANEPSQQGLFLYQFESLCRNRLNYDSGLEAMASDPAFDDSWREWILTVRRQIGLVDLADLIYVHSAYYHETSRPTAPRRGEQQDSQEHPTGSSEPRTLFGSREGRIALANRQKDPQILFASLHRQLGYPEVPFQRRADPQEPLLPSLARRVEQLESRLRLVEEEQRGGIDLTRFYGPPQQ